MLLRFSVENFRSIAGKQTLDLAASNYFKERAESNLFFVESGEKLPGILRTAAVYGPNAAGKSSLVRALDFFRTFVLESATKRQAGDPIDVQPFRLSPEFRDGDSAFEAVFLERFGKKEGREGESPDRFVRYQYGFKVNRQRVTEEWLNVYPHGRPQRWFRRTFDPSLQHYAYKFGSLFRKEKERLLEDWKAQTRENALFLSTAVQLNSEDLRTVFDWFRKRFKVFTPERTSPKRTFERLESDPEKKVLSFLRSLDLSIAEIHLEMGQFSPESLPPDLPSEIRERIVQDMTGKEIVKDLKFLHTSSDGNEQISFDFREESEGSRNLFLFSGLWLDMLEREQILVIDEIDTSLHPLVVRSLVERLQCAGCRAQLIFTTHDSSLLASGLLRRDQIWFVEKNPSGATELYPLSDFPVPKGEALEKRYLNGRYGAIPFFSGLEDV